MEGKTVKIVNVKFRGIPSFEAEREEQRRSGLRSESGVGRAVDCLKRKSGMGKVPIIAGYFACVSLTLN